MSEDSEDDVNFEEQVKLYNLEKEGKLDAFKNTSDTKKSYKDKDGVEYEWDEKQKAWFPKISEDFIAMYQASYGVAQSKDGGFIYTDPLSKKIMLWDETQKQWKYADTGLPVSTNPTIQADATAPDAVSVDPISGGYVYREPGTGTILYYWNQERERWIAPNERAELVPKEISRSLPDPNPELPAIGGSKGKKREKKKKKEKGSSFLPGPADAVLAPPAKKVPKPPEWFEISEEQNTNVYVSNLPDDITLPEFIELMSKYGIIMEDPAKGKLKIKLYQNDAGENKGDGRCCYLKKESVDLALQILDGSELRGKILKVERAKFTLKGDYDPKLKPNKPKSGGSKGKEGGKAKGQDKLLAWKPDPIPGLRTNREKTIVLKNMFDPKIFDEDASLILEYQKELREECATFGTVKKVKIYDRNPEGVAVVTFGELEEADACLEALNGRFYAGRKLEASRWDGKTRFVVEETEEEKEQRLQKWTEFLEKGE